MHGMIGSAAVAVGIYLGLGIGGFLIARQIWYVSSGRGRFTCVYCRAPLVNAYAKVCQKCGRDQPPTKREAPQPEQGQGAS